MFTKNYYVMQALNTHSIINSDKYNYSTPWNENLGQLTYQNGNSVGFTTNTRLCGISGSDSIKEILNDATYNLNITHSINLIIGSSNKEENLDDYSLATEISDLTESAPTTAINITNIGTVESGGTKILITKSYSNDTDSPITIKEIGLVKKYYIISPDNIYYTISLDPFLIARNVLDNPITVQPSETVTVSMTLEL